MSKIKKHNKRKNIQNSELKINNQTDIAINHIEKIDPNINFKNINSEEKNKNKNWFTGILDYFIEKQFFNKLFIICFATLVFSYVYSTNEAINRNALTYIGLILCVVVCYIEIVGIRDHLWVIEGSIPASKRWREVFFNPSSIRRHKIRKMIVLLFSFIVFTVIYKIKIFDKAKDIISFFGIILMVIAVYYEILAVRDEVSLLAKALKQELINNRESIVTYKTNDN